MKNDGFSVPEIIIVVLILCIIGAVVAPAFTKAQAEGKISDLTDRLQMMRAQIELYSVQHDGLLPGQYRAGGNLTESSFIEALTESDDELGPYLRKIPENPFNGLNTVVIGTRDDGNITGAGWFLNIVTGEFRADDSKTHSAY